MASVINGERVSGDEVRSQNGELASCTHPRLPLTRCRTRVPRWLVLVVLVEQLVYVGSCSWHAARGQQSHSAEGASRPKPMRVRGRHVGLCTCVHARVRVLRATRACVCAVRHVLPVGVGKVQRGGLSIAFLSCSKQPCTAVSPTACERACVCEFAGLTLTSRELER